MAAIWSGGSCFKAARGVMKNSSFTWEGKKTAWGLNYASNPTTFQYEVAGNETHDDSRKMCPVSKSAHARFPTRGRKYFFIVFYFWSNGPRSDAALPLYDPQSDGRCKTCLPSPIVYTAEETNVYLKWINSCYAVLFIRFIFWALILAYNIACRSLQLTEARLNCPE